MPTRRLTDGPLAAVVAGQSKLAQRGARLRGDHDAAGGSIVAVFRAWGGDVTGTVLSGLFCLKDGFASWVLDAFGESIFDKKKYMGRA